MERQRRWAKLALIILLVGIVAGEATLFAADGKISLDFKNTPVDKVLTSLFQGTGHNYMLAPGITSFVTVSLRDMDFDQALQATLRSANLTYRLEDGVYIIRQKDLPSTAGSYNKPVAPPAATSSSGTDAELPSAEVRIEKIQLIYVDCVDIAAMFGQDTPMSRGQMLANSGPASSLYGAFTQPTPGYGSGYGYGYGNSGYGYGGYGYNGYGANYGSNNGYGNYGAGYSGFNGYSGYRGYGY